MKGKFLSRSPSCGKINSPLGRKGASKRSVRILHGRSDDTTSFSQYASDSGGVLGRDNSSLLVYLKKKDSVLDSVIAAGDEDKDKYLVDVKEIEPGRFSIVPKSDLPVKVTSGRHPFQFANIKPRGKENIEKGRILNEKIVEGMQCAKILKGSAARLNEIEENRARICSSVVKKAKTVFTAGNHYELEKFFRITPCPTPRMKRKLAAKLNLSESTVKIWFNGRSKNHLLLGKTETEWYSAAKCETEIKKSECSYSALETLSGPLIDTDQPMSGSPLPKWILMHLPDWTSKPVEEEPTTWALTPHLSPGDSCCAWPSTVTTPDPTFDLCGHNNRMKDTTHVNDATNKQEGPIAASHSFNNFLFDFDSLPPFDVPSATYVSKFSHSGMITTEAITTEATTELNSRYSYEMDGVKYFKESDKCYLQI